MSASQSKDSKTITTSSKTTSAMPLPAAITLDTRVVVYHFYPNALAGNLQSSLHLTLAIMMDLALNYPQFFQNFGILANSTNWSNAFNQANDIVFTLRKEKLDQHLGKDFFKVIYLIELITREQNNAFSCDADIMEGSIATHAEAVVKLRALISQLPDDQLNHIALFSKEIGGVNKFCFFLALQDHIPAAEFTDLLNKLTPEICERLEMLGGLISLDNSFKRSVDFLIYLDKLPANEAILNRFFKKECRYLQDNTLIYYTVIHYLLKNSPEIFQGMITLFRKQKQLVLYKFKEMLLVDDKKEALLFISALIHLQPIKNILDIFDFFDSEISRLIAEIINNSAKLMDSRDAFLFLRALREKFMPEMSPEPSIVAYPSVIIDPIGSIIEALERYDEIQSSSARSDFREDVKVILDILPEHIIVKELVSIVLGYLKEAYEEMLLLADGHGLLRSLSRDDSKSTSVNSKDILVTLISNKLFTPVAIDTNLCGVNYLYDARKHQRMPMQLAVQRLRSAPVTEEYAVMQAYTSNVAKLVNPVEVTSIKALCIEAIYDSPDVRKLARDMRDNIASTSTNPSASPSYRINRLPIFFYDCQRRTAYAYTEEQQIADAKSAAITSSSGVAMTATTSSVATTVTTAARK